jgi:hypothetical protein
VDVLVLVLAEEFEVSAEGIFDFNLDGVRRPGTIPSGVVDDGYVEGVEMDEPATCFFIRRQGDRGSAEIDGRIEEAGFELNGRVLVGDSCEIFLGGVTGCALPCSVEELLAGFDVPGEETLELIAADGAVGFDAACDHDARVEEGCDVRELGCGEGGKGRHSLVGASLLNDGGDEISIDVVANERGVDEADAGTSPGTDAVTDGTGLLELLVAALHVFLVHGIGLGAGKKREGQEERQAGERSEYPGLLLSIHVALQRLS